MLMLILIVFWLWLIDWLINWLMIWLFRSAHINGYNILTSIQNRDLYIVQTIDYCFLMAMSPIWSTISSIIANRIGYFYPVSLPNLPTVFNLSILSPSRHTSTTIGQRIVGLNDRVDQDSPRSGSSCRCRIQVENWSAIYYPNGNVGMWSKSQDRRCLTFWG